MIMSDRDVGDHNRDAASGGLRIRKAASFRVRVLNRVVTVHPVADTEGIRAVPTLAQSDGTGKDAGLKFPRLEWGGFGKIRLEQVAIVVRDGFLDIDPGEGEMVG